MKYSILVIILSVLLVSCNGLGGDGAVSDKLDDSFVTSEPDADTIIDGQPICYEDNYKLSDEQVNRKLDILIVPDTSGSIKDERSNVAKGFHHFVNSLPEKIDYNIGVVLGHGPKSKYHGKLYRKKSEPYVLKSKEMNIEQIKANLDSKLFNPKTDNETDGGEMGLSSLLGALTEENISLMKTQGMMREDAALIVIFIADEQDICAQFPVGVTPVVDKQGGENRSFVKYCIEESVKSSQVKIGDSFYTYKITPEIVLNKLKEAVGNKPLIVGGVLYDHNSIIPTGNEDEIGYGYLDVISLANGINIDLGSGSYGDGLSKIGRLATTKVSPEDSYDLKTSKVDKDSIQIFIDGVNSPFDYDSNLNKINVLYERDPLSTTKITYCEDNSPPEIIVGQIDKYRNKKELALNIKVLDKGNVSTEIILNGISTGTFSDKSISTTLNLV